jgi:hypothetical protein
MPPFRGLSWHRLGSWVVPIFLAAVAVRPVGATASLFVHPTGGDVVVSGQLVEVRWQALDDDVDEMELLLLIGDRDPLSLRLTRQIDGSSRSILWRVPNLPVSRARLRLRWGRDGVETEGEPSEPFTILLARTAPFESLRFRDGEWWVCRGSIVDEAALDRDGRVVASREGRAIVAVMSSESETSHDGVPDRCCSTVGVHRRPGGTVIADPETTAHRPLTIPLRP